MYNGLVLESLALPLLESVFDCAALLSSLLFVCVFVLCGNSMVACGMASASSQGFQAELATSFSSRRRVFRGATQHAVVTPV